MEALLLEKGPQSKAVPLNQVSVIKNGDKFCVIRKNVAGGLEPLHIQSELEKLRLSGCRADFIQQPLVEVFTMMGLRNLAHLPVPGLQPGTVVLSCVPRYNHCGGIHLGGSPAVPAGALLGGPDRGCLWLVRSGQSRPRHLASFDCDD